MSGQRPGFKFNLTNNAQICEVPALYARAKFGSAAAASVENSTTPVEREGRRRNHHRIVGRKRRGREEDRKSGGRLRRGGAQTGVARHASRYNQRPYALHLLGGARGVPQQFVDHRVLKAGEQIERVLRRHVRAIRRSSDWQFSAPDSCALRSLAPDRGSRPSAVQPS